MVTTGEDARMAWWREPTRDQWLAWVAGWLGWTLDAFDFTIFLLLLVPITREFEVPLTAAALIVSLTLWTVGRSALDREAALCLLRPSDPSRRLWSPLNYPPYAS